MTLTQHFDGTGYLYNASNGAWPSCAVFAIHGNIGIKNNIYESEADVHGNAIAVGIGDGVKYTTTRTKDDLRRPTCKTVEEIVILEGECAKERYHVLG